MMDNGVKSAELLTTERARVAYQRLQAAAREILAEAQRSMDKLNLRDEERADAILSLANLEWAMERDAIEAATSCEREEQKLRAEVAAAGLLLECEIRDGR